MKLLTTLLFIFTLTFSYSQDYWEKLEVPSNLPALNLTIASDGSVFSSGIGIYRLDEDGRWESKNHLKTSINGIEFDGGLNEIAVPIYGLLELNSETLIAIMGEDLIIKSTDYGETWEVISNEVRRPQLLIEHNGEVIIASRRGVYKLNSELDSAISIYDSDSFFNEIIHNGNKLIAKYDDYIDNDYFESIKVFDLETEMFVDSITLSDFNVNGDYYENGTTSYILVEDTLYVSDVLIRTGAEPKITTYNLGQYFNQEMLEKHGVDLDAINFFDNDKMVISNSNSDEFLIADAQFSNPKVHRIFGHNVRVKNSAKKIYLHEDDYLVSTDFGIFKAENKNFNNLENISTTMGHGIYESVIETNDGYIASLNNFIYELNNDNVEILNAAERDLQRWNDSYWYSLDDSLFFTKDYGATWTKHIIEGQYYDSEYRSHTNNKFSVTASDEIFIVNYSDLSLQTISNPEFEDIFSKVKFITMNGNNIIAITSEGTFEYDESDNWTKIANNSFTDDLEHLLGYNGTLFESIGDNIVVFSDFGILKMENYGESIEPYSLILPRNPQQKYIRLGDKFFLYATEEETTFYDFYELYLDDQNNLVSNMLSEDQSTAIFQSFTPTKDGKLIVSNLSGIFKSKDQLVSSVEQKISINVKELFIYPNISDSHIKVVADELVNKEWKIYDLNGNSKSVNIISSDGATTTIDISKFSSGKYIISNNDASGFFVKN